MKNQKINIPYGRQWITSDDIAEVVKVLKSDFLTQGPKVQEFEHAICRYTGAKYAMVVCNATAALHLACRAAGIKKGDEVITSPITFVATSNAVLYCGGKPVFADIQEDTVNIDPNEIKKKITKKTKAIIPVHFAGQPADLKEISDIAKKNNLIVIEDASHAIGAKYFQTKIGDCRYSDMTVFSFHPVKLISTGEGGAITTNDKDFYEKLLILRNHGITKDSNRFINFNSKKDGDWYYEMQDIGYNYRITDIQCALGISQLSELENFIKKRTNIASKYFTKLKSIKNIVLPMYKSNIRHAWHIFVVRILNQKNRKSIFEKLRIAGIGVQIHYIPVYLQPYYRKLGYEKGLCPLAEDYYAKAITLPIFPSMREDQIDYVRKKLSEYI